MLISSAVVEDELSTVEVLKGVLVPTGVVEMVLPSELATCVVPTVIIINGVLPSRGVEVGMLVASAIVLEELT